MYNNYKIVVVTAAGRRHLMQYMIPYIVSSDLVDKYEIWVNTNNNLDIAFFQKLSEKYDVIQLVWQPEGIVNGNASINSFYRRCIDENTIYFKLDDDIVWMEPETIRKMIVFRLEHPDYFLVSPLVINNSLSTYSLQIEDKIHFINYFSSSSNHPVLWKSGEFACELHNWFIDNYLRRGGYEDLHIGKKEMGMTRFSINSVLWFGKDLKRIEGAVPGDDEEYLSCILPTKLGKSNAWNGDVLISHYSFFTQKKVVDKSDILNLYGEICSEQFSADKKQCDIHLTVSSIIKEIAKNEDYYKSLPLKYIQPAAKISLKKRIIATLPGPLLNVFISIKGLFRKSGPVKYIV